MAATSSTTFVALLRGINVGGRAVVAMSDLRDLAGRAGCANARTLIQSGNLVFEADADPAALEATLAAAAARRLTRDIDFFVRSAPEWGAIVAANPFTRESSDDPQRVVLMLLKTAADPAAIRQLQRGIAGREQMRASGRQLYIVYPDGMGRSKLSSALIERTLGTRGTARNWNTVLKLDAIVNGGA